MTEQEKKAMDNLAEKLTELLNKTIATTISSINTMLMDSNSFEEFKVKMANLTTALSGGKKSE